MAKIDCGHPRDWQGYGKLIAASGATHVVEWCSACHTRTTTGFIPRAKLEKRGIDIDSLELVKDNRTGDHPCERCGCAETESHHWAPRYLFDDAEDWPMGYLCRDCHRVWHDIVTPGMSQHATLTQL
ncbi:MAG: hypothetical protein O2992_09615 [Gemmatimonadetes bacterium]|nr:hypothetical protein [Gemmatimonadota bacterium]